MWICVLYLIEILHQTTTGLTPTHFLLSCILSKFYIKPQRLPERPRIFLVVSYRNSTSNHNDAEGTGAEPPVVSYRNSTSNHNDVRSNPLAVPVVSYRNSTSNHNLPGDYVTSTAVVSYRNSTSNHNSGWSANSPVVLYLIEILHQTTTAAVFWRIRPLLYLIEILHQTTTVSMSGVSTIPLYLIEILHPTTTHHARLSFL